MNARIISDQVVDRSRSIWRLSEEHHMQSVTRSAIKSALLDITIDTAMDLAYKSMRLVEQYEHAGPARQLRAMRELLSTWRTVIRTVKAVNSEHPIHECHLYLVLLDGWGTRLNAYEKLFGSTCVEMKPLYYERFGLRPYNPWEDYTSKVRRTQVRARIRQVLDACVGVY